jgi:hypothetical protein
VEPQPKIPTTADVLQRQREEHVVIVPADKLPAVTNGIDAVLQYVNEHAGGTTGTFFKLDGKDGRYKKTRDDEEVPVGTQMVCIYDQAQVGWIKFNGKGNPPDRHMGSLFDGFRAPKREELGDTDQALWERNLSGQPDDPWKSQILLPLQDVETGELFVFGTTSATGRKAVGNLLTHCQRMSQRDPENYPIVRLDTGGFQHRDERVGFVKTPAFPVIGKAPKSGAAKIDTSVAADLNDAMPF